VIDHVRRRRTGDDGEWRASVGDAPHVRDGDTIEVSGPPIRLNGLAAPERGEPGSRAATRAMIEMVQGETLRCELDGERAHDRCVAICYLEGEDISTVMVRRGLARNCTRFSGGRYAEAELNAAANGAMYERGILVPFTSDDLRTDRGRITESGTNAGVPSGSRTRVAALKGRCPNR
jgi:micrococcal nuclease